jgi:hypothetical protein
MNATVSSIHINGWYGAHNKWQGACWIVRELLGRALAAEVDRWVYVGDSTNDQLMFEHFTHSVGVANIARFVPQLATLPRYVTRGERARALRSWRARCWSGADRGGPHRGHRGRACQVLAAHLLPPHPGQPDRSD